MSNPLKLGLIINPLAGLGGSLGHKGSDGPQTRKIASQQAIEGEGQDLLTRSEERTSRALQPLSGVADTVQLFTWANNMGERVLANSGLLFESLGAQKSQFSDAADTRDAAKAMMGEGVDLILFSGGDGTARDIYDVVGDSLPVLGIPAGVKMHSGVFAVSPEAAGEVILKLALGGLVAIKRAEVRDIDEAAFRADKVRTRFYGEMTVPAEGQFLQHTKIGGREDQDLVAADIAAWVAENMLPDTLYILGPGSTTAAISEELGVGFTLLGIDLLLNAELLAPDLDENALLEHLQQERPAKMVVTAIGGQGHIFGRGNQQLSPAVIRKVGRENILLVAAKSKITALEGRPLLVDTNDPALDQELQGYWQVTTGYDDQIMYRVGRPWDS
jgi:predicted polyphosphate/ATP-dependent NAD kinase